MKRLCQEGGSGVCTQCGLPLQPRYMRLCGQKQTARRHYLTDFAERNGQPVQVQLIHPPCQHLGPKRFFRDGTPKTAKQTGCCGGGVVTFTPTYECAIFGKCAPFAAKIEDDADRTKPCQGCERHS